MNPLLRLAGVAVVAAVALGVVALIARPGNVGPSAPSPSPSPSLSPTAAPVPPIADGTYVADIPVAPILAALDADTTLSETDKTAVIDDVLGIRGATTLNMEITVARDSFNFGQGVDGGSIALSIPQPWTLTTIDDQTIGLQPEGGEVVRWQVVRSADGRGFTLVRLTQAPSAVETFVSRTLFQSVPYRPKA